MVVVPKTTLGNWCNEFKRWYPTPRRRSPSDLRQSKRLARLIRYPALRVLKFHGDKDERALLRERDLQVYLALFRGPPCDLQGRVNSRPAAVRELRRLCAELRGGHQGEGSTGQVSLGVHDDRRGAPDQERELRALADHPALLHQVPAAHHRDATAEQPPRALGASEFPAAGREHTLCAARGETPSEP
jgi:hypothetical protein